MRRELLTGLLVLLLGVAAVAKGKKLPVPEIVLRAETVMVMIDPEAGVSLTNPGENRDARQAVEQALRQWGRFRVVMYTNASNPPDLVIVIRKGGSKTTIGGIDPNDRGPTIDGTSDDTVTIGTGRRPASGPPSSPRIRSEMAPPEDTFAVYMGSRDGMPLGAPVWRYAAKNALSPPLVPAVKEFQKTIEAAEKQLAAEKNKKEQERKKP